MNYIKDISLGDVTNGLVNVIVEIPIGTNVKYEVEPSGNYLSVVRELNKHIRYPFNYGFLPQTLAGDNDPMDVILIDKQPIAPLTVVRGKVVGVIRTVDNEEQDDKILVVPSYVNISDHKLKRIVRGIYHFLKIYKYPNNKNTKVEKPILDSEQAIALIKETIK